MRKAVVGSLGSRRVTTGVICYFHSLGVSFALCGGRAILILAQNINRLSSSEYHGSCHRSNSKK